MRNVNVYPSTFKKTFLKTKLGKKILKENYDLLIEKELPQLFSNPREDMMTSCFSIVPFYYFNFLLEKKPSKIYDIGCGSNTWKKYFPNIVGIDPNNKKADVKECFNKKFIKTHANSLESIIAINSLHFIDIKNFCDRLIEVNQVLSNNGRAFVTFNLARLVKRPSKQLSSAYRTRISNLHLKKIELYLRKQLTKSKLKFVCIDIDFTNYNSFINGNIRLVFDKT